MEKVIKKIPLRIVSLDVDNDEKYIIYVPDTSGSYNIKINLEKTAEDVGFLDAIEGGSVVTGGEPIPGEIVEEGSSTPNEIQ